jgi:hypothetical protein
MLKIQQGPLHGCRCSVLSISCMCTSQYWEGLSEARLWAGMDCGSSCKLTWQYFIVRRYIHGGRVTSQLWSGMKKEEELSQQLSQT